MCAQDGQPSGRVSQSWPAVLAQALGVEGDHAVLGPGLLVPPPTGVLASTVALQLTSCDPSVLVSSFVKQAQ